MMMNYVWLHVSTFKKSSSGHLREHSAPALHLGYTTYNIQAEIATNHVTKHNTPIHNILSTAPQFSISQKALGKLPEDGNVMPKHVGATIHN
jgi:hypothetical protein